MTDHRLNLEQLQEKLKHLEQRIADIDAKMGILETRVNRLSNIIIKLNDVAFKEGVLLEEIRGLVKQLVSAYIYPESSDFFIDKKFLH